MSPTAKRWLIASLVTAVIVSTSLRTAWRGATIYLRYPQHFTAEYIKGTDDAIKEYRRKKGTLPRSLKQLRSLPNLTVGIDDEGQVRDSWEHPLVYSVHGESYRLLSYGRDGKPGGIGLDYDVTNQEVKASEGNLILQASGAQVPFWQFFWHPAVRGVVWTSLICGGLVFLLTLKIVRPEELTLRGSGFLAAKLVVTLLASLAVATMMALLHVPSGH